MKNSTQKVLLSEAQIDRRVEELAGEISAEYRGKKILLVCVLKGAVVFASDLMRRLKVAVEIDFMAVSSYGSETASSGAVRILKDLDSSIRGKDLLIVEDIVDTGLTLDYICKNLLSRKPSSLKVVTLLDKPARRKVEFTPDFCGFEIPDYFVVGYGLDFDENYRQLPGIHILQPGNKG